MRTFFPTLRAAALAGAVLGAVPALALAQTDVTPAVAANSAAAPVPSMETANTPKACVTVASTLQRQAQTDAVKLEGAERTKALSAAMTGYKTNLISCAKQFTVSTIAPEQLPDLVSLYEAAGMHAELSAALDRSIETAPTPADRAKMLKKAVSVYAPWDASPEQLALAERYVSRIDADGADAAAKASAHAKLADAYPAGDPKQKVHAEIALAAVQSLPADQRKGTEYASTLGSIAETYATMWQFDRAVSLLNEAAAADTTPMGKRYTTNAKRYSLVGKPAPQIAAEYWINAPAGTTTANLKGKVTLVEFTTTWCGWCKKGYPTIRTLRNTYQARGFQPMFVSLIEGRANGKPATTQEELAYDKAHWVTGDTIDFPIAIVDTKEKVAENGKAAGRDRPALFDQFQTGGYPSYYFIDRQGIIRYIQVGHSNDLHARFAAVIEKLTAEQTAAR